MPEVQVSLLKAVRVAVVFLLLGAESAAAQQEDQSTAWYESLMDYLFGSEEMPSPAAPPERPPALDLTRRLPTVEFAPGPREVSENDGSVSVRLVRSGSLDSESEVRWRVSGTGATPAVSGTDFLASPGVVVFRRGEAEKNLTLRIIDDGTWREPERRRLMVAIDDRVGALLGDRREVVIDIVEDDPRKPPVVPGNLVVVQAPAFGEVVTGRQAARTILLRNRGGAPIEVSRVLSDTALYAVVEDDCGASVLPPREACAITVALRPGTAGTANGRLTVLWLQAEPGAGEAGLQELTVPLSGRAVAPPEQPDPRAEAIKEARRARRLETGRVVSLAPAPRSPAQAPELRMESEDHAEIGLGWDRWSYPVPLERVLPSIKLIPCVLQITINSQLDGPVTCVVENPVFGHHGDLGRYVLLPAGTVFEGEYKSLEQAGDTRLPILWTRGFRQDGSSFVIADGLAALDAMGRAGAVGDVDDRTWEKYGSVGLLTLLNVAAAVAIPGDVDNTVGRAQAEMAGQLGEVTAQVMERNLDLRPISTVPKGTRLFIKPAHDMWFPHPTVLKSVAAPEAG